MAEAPCLAQDQTMGSARSAIVIGGGVIGVTSAYALARDGWQVSLIEQMDQVGMGASWGNGRQLSYSHTNALASPGLLPQIPALLLGLNDAFRLSPRLDADFAAWSLQFLKNCTANAYRLNTLSALKLAEKSRIAMEKLRARHALEFDYEPAGKMVLIRSEDERGAAAKNIELRRQVGVRQQILGREEAIKIEPALEQSPDKFIGALYSPDDATGNCHAFSAELLKLAQSQYDVDFIGGTEVASIQQNDDTSLVKLGDGEEREADLTVVANGHAANRLLKPLKKRLPIEPMKGYSFTAPLGNSAPRVSITDSKRRIVFTNLGDRMLVAGIAEMGCIDSRIDPERLASVRKAASEALPEAADYSKSDSGWVGFRPMTPDSQPITRMLSRNIAVNAGQGMLGWTLAMGSAEKLSETVAQSLN